MGDCPFNFSYVNEGDMYLMTCFHDAPHIFQNQDVDLTVSEENLFQDAQSRAVVRPFEDYLPSVWCLSPNETLDLFIKNPGVR